MGRGAWAPSKSNGVERDPSPALLRRAPSPLGEGCDFDFSPSPLGRGGTARRGVRGFFAGDASWPWRYATPVTLTEPCREQRSDLTRISHHESGRVGLYRLWKKPVGTVILSIDSPAASQEGEKLGPRKGSADLFFRSAAFPCPSGTCRGPKKQVRATPAEFQSLTRRVSAECRN